MHAIGGGLGGVVSGSRVMLVVVCSSEGVIDEVEVAALRTASSAGVGLGSVGLGCRVQGAGRRLQIHGAGVQGVGVRPEC